MLDDVVHAWHAVKAATALAPLGGGHFAPLTTIRLLPADIDAILVRKVEAFESVLRSGFANWDGFPAPAQLCILDMAWNMGPAFGFPKFRAACNTQDWGCAAAECQIHGAPKARNDAHVALLLAARDATDPDALPTSQVPATV
jgi:hypothetical protein